MAIDVETYIQALPMERQKVIKRRAQELIVEEKTLQELRQEIALVEVRVFYCPSNMGLTVSDAFRMLLSRVAHEKSLPFDPLIPNAETIEAMKAARRGELTTTTSVNLLADLNADD